MSGQVEIINIALARLGESPIQSLDEGSVSANMAKLLYDAERQATLRDYPWNFALKQATLACFDADAAGFHKAFALPADCLRAVCLRGTDRKEPFQYVLREGLIYANTEHVTLEYVADVTDPARFDAKFVEAFSYKLASALAMSIKSSPELMANYMNVYNSLVNSAAALSLREERENLSDNPYLEARF